MRSCALVFVLLGVSLRAAAQQPADVPAQGQPGPAPETETIEASPPAPAAPPATQAAEGFMAPTQVKALLHKIWLADYRIDDLLTQVSPERWKLSNVARKSFVETLDTLRGQLKALEDWRAQFDARPDSMYLGYMTYTAINAVLPRLDGVARGITRHENASLGAQFGQAGNQLFDLQQTLQPYLAFLLRNQDQVILAAQNNLASCQNDLGRALRDHTAPATPMKNVPPEFKGRRRQKSAASHK